MADYFILCAACAVFLQVSGAVRLSLMALLRWKVCLSGINTHWA